MASLFLCPGCGHSVSTDATVGDKIFCPGCGKSLGLILHADPSPQRPALPGEFRGEPTDAADADAVPVPVYASPGRPRAAPSHRPAHPWIPVVVVLSAIVLIGGAVGVAVLSRSPEKSNPTDVAWDIAHRPDLRALKTEAESHALDGDLRGAFARYQTIESMAASHPVTDPETAELVRAARIEQQGIYQKLLETVTPAASAQPAAGRTVDPVSDNTSNVVPAPTPGETAHQNSQPLPTPSTTGPDTVQPLPPAAAPTVPPQPTQPQPQPANLNPTVPLAAVLPGHEADRKIGASLDAGVNFLISRFNNGQIVDGLGPDDVRHQGLDALCVYALLHASQGSSDPRLNIHGPFMVSLIENLKAFPMAGRDPLKPMAPAVYAHSLRAAALAVYNRPEDHKLLQADVNWLVNAQVNGAYTYDDRYAGTRTSASPGSSGSATPPLRTDPASSTPNAPGNRAPSPTPPVVAVGPSPNQPPAYLPTTLPTQGGSRETPAVPPTIDPSVTASGGSGPSSNLPNTPPSNNPATPTPATTMPAPGQPGFVPNLPVYPPGQPGYLPGPTVVGTGPGIPYTLPGGINSKPTVTGGGNLPSNGSNGPSVPQPGQDLTRTTPNLSPTTPSLAPTTVTPTLTPTVPSLARNMPGPTPTNPSLTPTVPSLTPTDPTNLTPTTPSLTRTMPGPLQPTMPGLQRTMPAPLQRTMPGLARTMPGPMVRTMPGLERTMPPPLERWMPSLPRLMPPNLERTMPGPLPTFGGGGGTPGPSTPTPAGGGTTGTNPKVPTPANGPSDRGTSPVPPTVLPTTPGVTPPVYVPSYLPGSTPVAPATPSTPTPLQTDPGYTPTPAPVDPAPLPSDSTDSGMAGPGPTLMLASTLAPDPNQTVGNPAPNPASNLPGPNLPPPNLVAARPNNPPRSPFANNTNLPPQNPNPGNDPNALLNNPDLLRQLTKAAGSGDIPWDNSNSQYGLLGVWSGAEVGCEVPNWYWKAVSDHWRSCELSTGQWCYSAYDPAPTLAMSCAGTASLLIAHEWMDWPAMGSRVGRQPYSPSLAQGLKWLETGDNITHVVTPDLHYLGYTAYGIERTALASGFKYFGTHDWYAELAQQLNIYQFPNGAWGNSADGTDSATVNTAYMVLFLSRGRHPILMNKLRFDPFWDNRPKDVANLAKYAGIELERPFNWQVVSTARPWSDWMDAPILYIASHKPPTLTDDDCAKLKAFAEAGGMIFTHCDSNSGPFNNWVEQLQQRLWPQYPLQTVPRDSVLYSSNYHLAGDKKLPNFKAISNGSRYLLVHCPTDSLSAPWQDAATSQKDDFQMGINLFVYAAGRSNFRNRLDSPFISEPTTPPSGTIRLARLKYDGNWNPEPYAYTRFDRYLHWTVGTAVDIAPVDLSALADLIPADRPVAVLTGNAAVTFTDAQAAAVAAYVKAGGTILIDSTGGNADFAKSAQALIAKALPETPLADCPPTDPLLAGGTPLLDNLTKPIGRPFNTEMQIKTTQVQIIHAPTGPGRVIFTPLDLTTGLLGTNTWGIAGYDPEYAQKLVKNVVETAGMP